jgi:hypothetical protein
MGKSEEKEKKCGGFVVILLFSDGKFFGLG